MWMILQKRTCVYLPGVTICMVYSHKTNYYLAMKFRAQQKIIQTNFFALIIFSVGFISGQALCLRFLYQT